MKPAPGTTLGGRYKLTRQIAIGGMGEVWAADDGMDDRQVAVKVLRDEYTGQEDFLRRLRTEARNSAALSHPNIAQMYDYGEQDGAGYLVMELVDGEPLVDLLEREPILPPGRLLPILSQVARGLHHAHLAGVVHRDVKPGNILLQQPRMPLAGPLIKVTDFGVSLAANQMALTATGMVMGTAQYLSPEQAIGKAATPLSDVYALGIIAYEASAGQRPFTGATAVEIAVAQVNEPVPPLPATVPEKLAALIYRLLDKTPEKRATSAAAVADEMDALVKELDLQRIDPGGRSYPDRLDTQPTSEPRVDPARWPATRVAHGRLVPSTDSAHRSTSATGGDPAPRSHLDRLGRRAATGLDAARPMGRAGSGRSHARRARRGRQVSWPTIGLVALLVLLLLVALLQGLFGNDETANTLPGAAIPAHFSSDSAMILPNESPGTSGATTMPKDANS
jgi:serine/threonine-protein kinase